MCIPLSIYPASRPPPIFHSLSIPLLVSLLISDSACPTPYLSHFVYLTSISHSLSVPLTMAHSYIPLCGCRIPLSHSVCVLLHVSPTPCVLLRVCPTPCVSHSVYVPLRVCPTACVSLRVSHFVCLISCVSFRVYLTLCVSHSVWVFYSLSVPLRMSHSYIPLPVSHSVSPTPCVSHWVRISLGAYPTPCRSLSVCPTPCVYYCVCIPLVAYFTRCVSHSVQISLCVPLHVCPTPRVSHSVCVSLRMCYIPFHVPPLCVSHSVTFRLDLLHSVSVLHTLFR